MITSLIDRLTRLALRYKWITLGLVVLALVAGLFALTQLNQELIPSMEFPANVVLAPNNGATAEQMREQVTIPIENAVKDIDGVVNVQSTTTNGLAYLMIMNEFGLDQEEFRAELRAALDKVALPNGMKKPQLVNFSFDDLPLVYAGVSAERPLPELKALVAAEIVPALKGVPGVADVQIAGGQELPAATPTPAGQPTPAAPAHAVHRRRRFNPAAHVAGRRPGPGRQAGKSERRHADHDPDDRPDEPADAGHAHAPEPERLLGRDAGRPAARLRRQARPAAPG